MYMYISYVVCYMYVCMYVFMYVCLYSEARHPHSMDMLSSIIFILFFETESLFGSGAHPLAGLVGQRAQEIFSNWLSQSWDYECMLLLHLLCLKMLASKSGPHAHTGSTSTASSPRPQRTYILSLPRLYVH